MKNNKQILSLLGLAKRAGKIISGENNLLNGIKNNQITFLVIAKDTGSASYKKFTDKANSYQIPICKRFTKDQISESIGLSRTMIGITDAGFSKKFVELTQDS